jgi:hypothetical protein
MRVISRPRNEVSPTVQSRCAVSTVMRTKASTTAMFTSARVTMVSMCALTPKSLDAQKGSLEGEKIAEKGSSGTLLAPCDVRDQLWYTTQS